MVFSGQINSLLNGIAEFSDPIEIPPNIIMKGTLEQSHVGFRGKILDREEYGNILQSIPCSSVFYMILELLLLFLPKLSPSSAKKSSKLAKFTFILSSVQVFFLESSIIDLWFYSILNIAIFPRKSSKSSMDTVSFSIAVYILVSSTMEYFKCITSIKKELCRFEKGQATSLEEAKLDIGLEGLLYTNAFKAINEQMTKKKDLKVRQFNEKISRHLQSTMVMNTFFRVQLIIIPVFLVTG